MTIYEEEFDNLKQMTNNKNRELLSETIIHEDLINNNNNFSNHSFDSITNETLQRHQLIRHVIVDKNGETSIEY